MLSSPIALQSEHASIPHIQDLLSSLTQSPAPKTRSQTHANTKRKRSPSPVPEPRKQVVVKDTPLPSLFIESMNEDQIWQQLELRAGPLCSNLQLLEGEIADDGELSEGMYDGSDDEEDDELSDQSGDSEEEDDSNSEDATGFEEEVIDLREESEDEEDESDDLSLPDVVGAKRSSKRTAVKTRNSDLDDDFFSLDAFNRETEEAEAAAVSRGRLGRDSEDDESDFEGDSIDLFKPVDDVEDLDDHVSEDGAGM